MGEIRLDKCCRLCLKEGFSLTNIFSHRSAVGDPLYRILDFIYDIKIVENDGLPSQICSPCMWRMIEFDACKRNVRSAEAEVMKLLKQTRPDGASAAEIECDTAQSEVRIKEELDIVESERPVETVMKHPIPEPIDHFNEDGYHELESREVETVNVFAVRYVENRNEQVFCQPSREFSDVPEPKIDLHSEYNCDTVDHSSVVQSSCSSSIPGMSWMEDMTRQIPDKYVRDKDILAEESITETKRRSNKDVAELEFSGSTIPLDNLKKDCICVICGKSFSCKNKLRHHVGIHYNERPFICSVCGKGFKQENVRREHELTHLKDKRKGVKSEVVNDKKLYPCDICGKKFGSLSNVNRHIVLHNKKYPCSTCGKKFGSQDGLDLHLRIHLTEKPFHCSVCPKSFHRKDGLQEHLASHSDERPFSCNFCDKKFKLKRVLTQHEYLHLKNS